MLLLDISRATNCQAIPVIEGYLGRLLGWKTSPFYGWRKGKCYARSHSQSDVLCWHEFLRNTVQIYAFEASRRSVFTGKRAKTFGSAGRVVCSCAQFSRSPCIFIWFQIACVVGHCYVWRVDVCWCVLLFSWIDWWSPIFGKGPLDLRMSSVKGVYDFQTWKYIPWNQ